MVRSFAEHRAVPEAERRTAIVENASILGPLFLFNNLHAAHHLRHRLPWYQTAEILSAQPGGADRAQWRPRLSTAISTSRGAIS